MGKKRKAIFGGLSFGAVFFVFWQEVFAYARSRFYDWLLARVGEHFNPQDPRVIASTELLSLWGPVFIVALMTGTAIFVTYRYANPRYLERIEPEAVPVSTDAVRYSPAVEAIIDEKSRFTAAAMQALRGEPTRDRNASVAEALGWAIHATWGTPIHALVLSIPPLNLDGPIERFREAARSGELRVWGRREPEGLIELIDCEFWEDNTIDKRSFRNVFSPSSTTPFEGVEKNERFYGIMVNRSEVERVWPHAG